ncbi:hypothetical protein PR001_g5252 [Phytophthora rubi]|uniref:WW domain-containing protein n=1 Tax=Phytophthora rubi TaxID=129364 RepID=A0A6A3NCS0_9STRA|nr:hypothetical protein PR002_g5283 [Phytophthora rubi]KAE9044722.1 hypothetical protein PR001_g5252 [Phytophthora rubi]
METPNVVVAARSGTISSPPNEVDEILPALEVKDDRFAVEGSRSANKASRSPKRRAKKPKGPLSVKSVSLKKSRAVVNREQCSSSQPAAVDASAFAVLKSRTPSPEDDGRRGEEEEDPLRLHHQEVARSFLKRISSRKVVDLETGSIQSQPSKEQVGGDNEVGAAESVAAKTVLTATNIEDQVELNVIPVKDEYNGGTLDPVRPSDSESTVEKHPLAEGSVRSPATTADVATTPSTERVDMTPVFTSSVDEDFTSSSATAASYAEALQSSVVEASNLGKERRMPISEDAQPELEISTIVADTNQAQSPRTFAPEHYQRAARKIQAQYRCFARRRIILDQLRFIMAKQRREARRQSRVKTKRTKEVVVDTFASVPTGEYESHITDVNRFGGGLSEDIHQVAVEMSSAAPLIQLGEDVKFAAQKDSGDYVLDLFDGSNQANGEVTQEVYTGNIAETADEVSVILPHNAIGESATSSENLVDQQDLYAASEKDVDTVNIANATISREPLQREEGVFDERPLRPNSLGLGVETQQPAGVGLISSTLLAELAFDDVEGEQPAVHEDPLRGLQPHWERYMDSATNKSFYFNPATNETQWTNPEDHSVINSIGTPTTSHVTVTAKVNSASKTAQVRQEFLDETSGQLYYYNTQTGECSWEAPAANSDAAEVVASPQSGATAETAASPWIMYIDPASQAPYYVNVETLVTTWEQPDEFALAAPESTAVVTADADSVIEDAYVIAVDD